MDNAAFRLSIFRTVQQKQLELCVCRFNLNHTACFHSVFIRAKTYYQWTDRRVGKGLMFSAAGEKFGVRAKAYKVKSSGFK